MTFCPYSVSRVTPSAFVEPELNQDKTISLSKLLVFTRVPRYGSLEQNLKHVFFQLYGLKHNSKFVADSYVTRGHDRSHS